VKSLPQARRTGNRQWVDSPIELPVEDDKGQTSEMIAVQMTNKDCLNLIGIDAEPVHGNRRRRAAINKKSRRRGGHVEAGVEATAAAKGITATEEL
jgi:hypothetical protein